ncbi:PAS domain-containing protein [Deltaproteobacteria bacterium PRO3]|nr:PAS domain-containing protein [Deltaproteobacteria bacterium PRO3]
MHVKEGASPPEQSENLEELKNLFAVVSEGKRAWEATFDAILDPVLVVTRDYRIVRANLAAADSAGLKVRELIGKPCFEIFAKEKAPCSGCPMRESLASGRPRRERLTPYSDQRAFVVGSFPIRDYDGKGGSLAVVQYQDVSAIRKLEAQLLQSEKMAALGLFASGIAHDINNPLAGVLAFAQLAMQGLAPESQLYQDLKEIESSALRCKKILEDLLEMSRPSGRAEKSPVDLGVLIERVLPNLKVQYQDQDYRLDLALKPLTPVEVCPSKFEQVFTNILTNAFQALKPGGSVRVSAHEDDKSVVIEVEDDGEGISEENLKNIFDPYFTTKRQRGGSGLGLPICYNIIREHGGQIEVSSRVNEGSVFRIRVPKGDKG